uniref:Putative secreted protein n=1 Tax=Anopheles darlingi TaxID=43151 RepID=A0A2M4D7S0_ANODA
MHLVAAAVLCANTHTHTHTHAHVHIYPFSLSFASRIPIIIHSPCSLWIFDYVKHYVKTNLIVLCHW